MVAHPALRMLGALVPLVILAGCASPPDADADRAALIALDQAYADTWKAGDAEAVLALFTEDAVLIPHHGVPHIEGLAAIRAFWFDPSYPPTVVVDWQRTPVEVVVEGDVGMVRGRSRLTWEYAGKRTTIPEGSYLLNAVRTAAGWRIRMLAWTDDPRAWIVEALPAG